MSVCWAKINDNMEVDEEVLNWRFAVPYPYVNAGKVVARPHLRKELLEPTEVVGFDYKRDGRDSEATKFGTKSEAGTVAGPDEEGYQPSKTRWEKIQAKFEKRVLRDYRYQMQTRNQERVAFVDMEFMEMSGFCRDGIDGGKGRGARGGGETSVDRCASGLTTVRYAWR